MAMMQATEREGMVYGTGWDVTGIWNYFASFYGHAWLWQGNGRKAAEVLYAFANHSAPMLIWREEQSLKGEKYKIVGDMPHNWASAEFIRLTVHLLALDRGNDLHLFEGLPAEWTRPGMVTGLKGIATPFGKLSMSLKVAGDGKSARLTVDPLSDKACRKIVVHLCGWAEKNEEATLDLDPSKKHKLTIPIAKDRVELDKSNEGPAKIVVPVVQTKAVEGEKLTIKILLQDKQPMKGAALFYRVAGKGEYLKFDIDRLDKTAYEAKLLPAMEDFEYYIEAEKADGSKLVWPASAPAHGQIVRVSAGK
jgi:hypothetical protein